MLDAQWFSRVAPIHDPPWERGGLIVYPILIGLGVAALRRPKTRDLFYAASILSAMGLMLNVVYVYNEIVYIDAASCAVQHDLVRRRE